MACKCRWEFSSEHVFGYLMADKINNRGELNEICVCIVLHVDEMYVCKCNLSGSLRSPRTTGSSNKTMEEFWKLLQSSLRSQCISNVRHLIYTRGILPEFPEKRLNGRKNKCTDIKKLSFLNSASA